MSDIGGKTADAVQQWSPNFVFDMLPETDRHVYRMLHNAHCDRKEKDPGHECKGAITIRRDTVTLRCPLCGIAKASILPGASARE